MTLEDKQPIQVRWRGVTALRTVVPLAVWYGATAHHPEPQWLLQCYDVEKGANRDYALKDCDFAGLERAFIPHLRVVDTPSGRKALLCDANKVLAANQMELTITETTDGPTEATVTFIVEDWL